MRPIKFRGQNPYTKEWKYGYYFVRTQLGIDYPQIWQEDGTPVPVDPKTVGQYIGKHDGKGAEVYEGDIIHRPYIGIPMIVRWNEKNAEFDLAVRDPTNFDAVTIFYTQYAQEYEIIGNIYDNPELVTLMKSKYP